MFVLDWVYVSEIILDVFLFLRDFLLSTLRCGFVRGFTFPFSTRCRNLTFAIRCRERSITVWCRICIITVLRWLFWYVFFTWIWSFFIRVLVGVARTWITQNWWSLTRVLTVVGPSISFFLCFMLLRFLVSLLSPIWNPGSETEAFYTVWIGFCFSIFDNLIRVCTCTVKN